MKLWTKLYRWLSRYDRRMRVLGNLSRDEARFPAWNDMRFVYAAEKAGLVFEVDGEGQDWMYKYYKLTDAGAKAVEDWRNGR